MNAYSFLIEAAHRYPSTPACISAERTVTYGELLRETEELRDSLIAHGLRPGMGLGLVAQNSAEFIIGLFAGLACEAVVMPLAPDLKEQEFNRILELVPMTAILHDGSLINKPRCIERYELDSFEILVRPAEFHCKVASGVPRAAVIRFTSGTTGSSKGVVLSHNSVSERTRAAAAALNIGPGTKVLWVLPMAHHFIVSILTYIRYGATVIVADATDPTIVVSTAREHNPHILYGSPALLESLTTMDSHSGLPPSMRVISTSTGMSRESLHAFEERFSAKVSQIYGLIEVGLPLGNLEPGRYLLESVGVPMPGCEVAILDPQGRGLPAGKIGRLAVRGPGMFDAYLAPYRPSSEVLTHGWFLTGDLATLGYDGSVTVCGRERSVIHAHGEKVFPEEVEGVLNSFPGVRSSRVFGVQSTNLDEMVVAEVVPTTTTHLDLNAIHSYLSERLSPHKVPSRFVIVPSIPLTQTGKVIRSGWHNETTRSH
jgi:acyl-CoA synthetase (AMP-forming)/AMP-acid ligase II